MTRDDLRKAALEVFRHALRAVDARAATRKVLSLNSSLLLVANTEVEIANRPVYVVGIGKAAPSMAHGVNDVLGKTIEHAVISGPASNESLPPAYQVFAGGHPLPNQQSLDAATAAFELLDRASREQAFVIFLISGGGSAMMEWPVSEDITLSDLQETNRELVTCGATISEINAVRRSISAVKGGRLALRAPDAKIVTLLVSDTNRGDESSVASGPTVPASKQSPLAQEVVEKYGLASTLPATVLTAIRHSSSEPNNDRDTAMYVLLDNRGAMDAAAEKAAALGFSTAIADDINEQPVEDGSGFMLTRAKNTATLPICLISGGEFSCRVRGDGRGGRNLETVLRCAIKIDEEPSSRPTVILSAGTDGIDGSSFAAGAIADELTIRRGWEVGMNAHDYLQQSNSHAYFEALEDLIVTGPTGTNVRDLRLVLRSER